MGPGEIDFITAESVEILVPPSDQMKICTFLWVYYGYPSSSYEGTNVEQMRCRCGAMLAEEIPLRRTVLPVCRILEPRMQSVMPTGHSFPFPGRLSNTPLTWPRSFMPHKQSQRNLIAKMKLIPVDALIRGNRLVLIGDSLVRGTQLRETTEFLYHSGAKKRSIFASPAHHCYMDASI